MRHFIWLFPEKGPIAVNMDRIISVEETEHPEKCIITIDGFKEPMWYDVSADEIVGALYREQKADGDEMPTKVDGVIRIINEGED